MTFSMPNSEQINAVVHQVVTAVAAASAVLVYVGLSQGDATALGKGIEQIGGGIASIIAGITTLIPIASALYSLWDHSPWRKMTALKADPEIAQVIAVAGTPLGAIADEIPGNKITTTAVVPVPASTR